MPHRSRHFGIAMAGLFSALALVLNKIPRPPNTFELSTFTVFAAGYLGGRAVGASTGALLGGLQFMTAGGGGPFLLLAQVAGWSTAGFAGALFSRRHLRPGVLAVTGVALTTWYQVLVNLALIPGSGLGLWAVLIPGLSFAATQIATNAIVFEAGRFLLLTLESHPAMSAWLADRQRG